LPVVLWATDRKSYGRLSRLLTVGRRRAEKGVCRLTMADIAEHAEGLIAGVQGSGFGVQGSDANELSTQYPVPSTQYEAEKDQPRLRVVRPDLVSLNPEPQT